VVLVLGVEKIRHSNMSVKEKELSLKERFPDWDWDYWEAQVEATVFGGKNV